MIENKTIRVLNCIDDKSDKLKIIDGICFDTRVLNIKCCNNLIDKDIITDVFLDKKTVIELCECLKQWVSKV